MAALDIRTLVLVANLVSLAMAVIFALVARGEHGRTRPLRFWTASFLLKSAGLLLIYMRSSLPDVLSFVVSNTLIVMAAQAILSGFRALRHRPIRWAQEAAGWLFTGVALTLAHRFGTYSAFVVTVSLLVILLEAAVLRELLWLAPKGQRRGHGLVAGVLGVETLLIIVRVGWLLVMPAASTAHAPATFSVIFYLQIILGSLLLGTALLALIYRRALARQEELIGRLEMALGEVRTLEGLLPICSWCKKIRDEEGQWHSVERYVSRHTGAAFTHGVCPDCMQRFE